MNWHIIPLNVPCDAPEQQRARYVAAGLLPRSRSFMPVHRTTTSEGPAMQWGEHGARYPYIPGNPASREHATEKATEQGKAARAHEYKDEKPANYREG